MPNRRPAPPNKTDLTGHANTAPPPDESEPTGHAGTPQGTTPDESDSTIHAKTPQRPTPDESEPKGRSATDGEDFVTRQGPTGAAGAGVGVGPHPEPWPVDERYDPVLLAEGDHRNVIDRYRYWTMDAIVADLDLRRHGFHVAIENWQHDRNIGAVVRNANAFLAAAVHIVGRRRWNRRGAMVTDRYQHVAHHASIDDFASWAADAGLAVIGIDNVDGSVPLESTALPRHCVLLFGQEGPGLSAEAIEICTTVCDIAMFGSTRSINAGVASGIAMHTWIRQHAEGVTSC